MTLGITQITSASTSGITSGNLVPSFNLGIGTTPVFSSQTRRDITPPVSQTTLGPSIASTSTGYNNLVLPDSLENMFITNYQNFVTQFVSNASQSCASIAPQSADVQSSSYDPSKSFRPYDYNKYGDNGAYISKLSPAMQEKVMKLLDYAQSQGIKVKITSGYRTYQKQCELAKQYANQPGRAAKPGTSPHEFGRAIDIEYKSLSDSAIQKLAKYAKEVLGMRWGGDFSKCCEVWHFEIPA